MRKIFACTLAILCVFVAFGRTATDSVKVYFRLNRATFENTLAENAASMDSFVERLSAVIASGDLEHIVIYGYASPEGPAKLNESLANARSRTLANIIKSRVAVNPEYITVKPSGIAWNELRQLIATSPGLADERDLLLEIVDNEALSATDRIRRMKKIGHGEPYEWMVQELFPQLRYAMGVAVFRKTDVDNQTNQVPANENADNKLLADTIISGQIDSIPSVSPIAPALPEATDSIEPTTLETDEYRPRHLLALKTNLLYYGALMPNIAIEWLINDNWSVEAEANVAWWWKESTNRSYRLAVFDAEGRYWIKPRAPWHGFYVGAFAGGGLYDLENGGTGKQGKGFMTGISCGYMWPIKHNLSFEAGIGGGYMYTSYREYIPYEGHYVYQRTKSLNYFGPLKLKFSLVWRFLDQNKLKPKRPEPQI